MRINIDFISSASASNFSSAFDILVVRVGGLGLGASGWCDWDGGGGGGGGSGGEGGGGGSGGDGGGGGSGGDSDLDRWEGNLALIPDVAISAGKEGEVLPAYAHGQEHGRAASSRESS